MPVVDKNQDGPSWKHRRRLIYASYILGAGMVIFGAITHSTDTQVASQMVIGGVGLITVILTAYTGFAAYEDIKLWNDYSKFGATENPNQLDNNNPDGL